MTTKPPHPHACDSYNHHALFGYCSTCGLRRDQHPVVLFGVRLKRGSAS